MNLEKFSQAINDIYSMELRNNREEIWCLKFYEDNPSKTYITTIFTKAIGLISAIMKINEELKIGPGRGECTGFVTQNIGDIWLDKQLSEHDLDKLRCEMMENNIVEISI